MLEPYTAPLIARVLRGWTPTQLAAAHPHQFHRWPTRNIVPSRIIRDLISNERARRASK